MKITFDKNWTLFLDRDGVINERLPGEYVKHWDQFVFTKRALESIAYFSTVFGQIVVVTNQQGVGKGLMTQTDLDSIHNKLQSAVTKGNGRLDQIYACTSLKSANDINRKPNPGMAYQAQADFEEINFEKSIMVGDSISDIELGKRLGMKTVLVDTKQEEKNKTALLEVDFRVQNLYEFALKIGLQ